MLRFFPRFKPFGRFLCVNENELQQQQETNESIAQRFEKICQASKKRKLRRLLSWPRRKLRPQAIVPWMTCSCVSTVKGIKNAIITSRFVKKQRRRRNIMLISTICYRTRVIMWLCRHLDLAFDDITRTIIDGKCANVTSTSQRNGNSTKVNQNSDKITERKTSIKLSHVRVCWSISRAQAQGRFNGVISLSWVGKHSHSKLNHQTNIWLPKLRFLIRDYMSESQHKAEHVN